MTMIRIWEILELTEFSLDIELKNKSVYEYFRAVRSTYKRVFMLPPPMLIECAMSLGIMLGALDMIEVYRVLCLHCSAVGT